MDVLARNAFIPAQEDTDRYSYLVDKSGRKFYYLIFSKHSKLDMNSGNFVSIIDPEYSNCTFPTINELVNSGELKEVEELFIGSIRGANTEDEAAQLAKEQLGIDLPAVAFEHNINAWRMDYKSGYVFGEYFIFTPIRDNPLRFDIERYVGADWQEIYIA